MWGRHCGTCAFVVLVRSALMVLALVVLVRGQMRVAPRRADERGELLHRLRDDELRAGVGYGRVSGRWGVVVHRRVRRLVGIGIKHWHRRTRVGAVVARAALESESDSESGVLRLRCLEEDRFLLVSRLAGRESS